MSTADKLNKLLETKQAIKQAIVDKGVEVGDDTKFSDYPAKIASIESGGGADPWFETMWNVITNNNTDYSYLFSNYNGKTLDLSNLDTSNAISIGYMFYFCSSSTILGINNFNTSKVTNMNRVFYYAQSLETLDLSNWDTKKVSDMSYMFSNCSGLIELNLSNWDVSAVSTMSYMFQYCRNLTILDLSGWDISKITASYMVSSMFSECPKLADFKAPKNINVNMSFSSCTQLTHDSLMSIINNLATVTTTKTLTLGSTNLAKLTDDEKAIATNKGWTLK